MSPTMSRRAVLAGLAIVAPATAIVAAPMIEANPDAELLDLVREYFAATEDERRACDAFNAIDGRQDLSIPKAILVRPEDEVLGIWRPAADRYEASNVAALRSNKWYAKPEFDYDEDDDRHLIATRIPRFTPSAEARARADEVIQAFDKRTKKLNRKPRGYRTAERQWNAAFNQMEAIMDKVLEMPARTLEGIIGKARVMESWVEQTTTDSNGERWSVLVRDLRAFARQA